MTFEELDSALASGNLELHGNYIWVQGTHRRHTDSCVTMCCFCLSQEPGYPRSTCSDKGMNTDVTEGVQQPYYDVEESFTARHMPYLAI